MIRRLLVALTAMCAFPGAASALAIPSVPVAPAYFGAPANAHPVKGIAPTPHNPYMAPNGRAEIHNDAWQTDAYRWSGPLGRRPKTLSLELSHDCGSITFDTRGRIVSVCVGIAGPQLYMIDPHTLTQLATFTLPPRQDVPSNVFQDFTGGGYFYLDNHDRVVTATTTKHIYVIAEKPGTPGFTLQHDYDLSKVLSAKEKITSALPDSHGLLWFVARTDGVVGTLDFKTGRIHAIHLGRGSVGEIENSFATGMHGDVYIASNRKLYRFRAAHGVPKIVWQIAYPNSRQSKPGQVDDGTGTTPTVMQGGYVNITDNADPMDIVVYRTAPHPTRVVRRHGHRHKVRLPRLLCKVPVFSKGASDSENSIIVAGRAMLVENNYGYTGPAAVTGGKVTSPGFARVDINRSGRGCHLVWTNRSVIAPTVVPKLSLGNGLVYTYTKGTNPLDPWYWTALDFRTGRVVYKQESGTGIGFNNNYAGIAISRSGTEYLGTIGGVVALRDGG